jgi:hypothetical protein
MGSLNIESVVRLIGVTAFLFILYSLWMGKMTAAGLPDGYSNPVLALELVKDQDDIRKIVAAENGKARDFLRRSTYKDFGFIAVYTVFFVGLSLLLSRLDFSWAKPAGYAAAICAALAAVMDLIEDRGMLKALAGEASNALANSIRYPSLVKWGLLFLFSLLVGLLLCARQGVFWIPGAFFLIGALLGLAGVFSNLLSPWFYRMFPWSLGSMAVAVMALTIVFIIWPAKLLSK